MAGVKALAFNREEQELPHSLTHPHVLGGRSESPGALCIDPAPVLDADAVQLINQSIFPVDQDPSQDAAPLAVWVVGFVVHRSRSRNLMGHDDVATMGAGKNSCAGNGSSGTCGLHT